MKNITVRDILKVTSGHLIGKINDDYREELLNYSIEELEVDSRKVKENTLFVAIPGENVDPHKSSR